MGRFLLDYCFIFLVIFMAEKEAKQEAVEEIEPVVEAAEDEELEKDSSLSFPNATVVREIKKHVDSNKMIKRDVKVAMNRFLGDVVRDVSLHMNDHPYTMIDYRMFEDAIKPYKLVKELEREKERLVTHLDVIVQDCLSIKRDLDSKFSSSEL